MTQEWLRVKQKDTGHELSLPKTQVDFAPDAYDVIKDAKKPATDAGGNPNPPKFHTTVNQAAGKKAAAPGAQAITTEKENG